MAYALRICIVLPSYYKSDLFEVINLSSIISPEEVVARKYNNLSDTLLIIGGSFQVLSLLQIVLSWFNLLTKLTDVFPPENVRISERTIKRIVYISSIVYLFQQQYLVLLV